jgi:hypothetical protein
MSRSVPEYVHNAVNTLCDLLIRYGNESAPAQAATLRKALQAGSPLLWQRANLAAKNSLHSGWSYNATDEEKQQLGEALVLLEEWQSGKPGPPKYFPHRLEVRYDEETLNALKTLRERTGDDNSTIIRRLIAQAGREANG